MARGARGAADERLAQLVQLAQLEAAFAQLGARVRRLEESSSARAAALEQRLGRLALALALPRASDGDGATPRLDALFSRHEPGDAHAHGIRARSMKSLLFANGISLSKDISESTLSSPDNETKNYFISLDETNPSPVPPVRRTSELPRAAGCSVTLEQQRCLFDGAVPLAHTALRDKGLHLAARRGHDPDVLHGSGRKRLHAAARWAAPAPAPAPPTCSC